MPSGLKKNEIISNKFTFTNRISQFVGANVNNFLRHFQEICGKIPF